MATLEEMKRIADARTKGEWRADTHSNINRPTVSVCEWCGEFKAK